MSKSEELLLKVQRGLHGAYLWRTRANANGTHEEELLSENSVFRVVDCSLYLKQASQPVQYFSHRKLEGMAAAYLLVYHGKTIEPAVQFAFEGGGLDCSSEDVEFASINIVVEGPQEHPGIVLSFVLWQEDGKMNGSFLGGTQPRLIRHLHAVQQLLDIQGGETDA